MNSLIKILMMVVLTVFPESFALAAPKNFKLPGFEYPFSVGVDRNQPGGFGLVPDPLDAQDTSEVFQASIKPGPCVREDCEQQSARASARQVKGAKQPDEAWYGWDMYFVPDFPIGSKQVRGHQIFTEFKDQDQCQLAALQTNPHSNDQYVSWGMEKPSGQQKFQFGGDCIDFLALRVAAIKDLVGSWHRFELFAKWSKARDGKFQMFLDGKQVIDYTGITCFTCDKLNYFLFGNYLCCTTGTKNVVPATVYYRFISSAKTREALVWK